MKLTKTTRIPLEDKPTNCYCLYVDNMSGDADDYRTMKTLWSENDEFANLIALERILKFILEYKKRSHNRQCDICQNVRPFIEEIFADDPTLDKTDEYWADEVSEWLWDAVGWDVSCADMGFMASIQDYKLTHFDENGDEWNVKVEM